MIQLYLVVISIPNVVEYSHNSFQLIKVNLEMIYFHAFCDLSKAFKHFIITDKSINRAL